MSAAWVVGSARAACPATPSWACGLRASVKRWCVSIANTRGERDAFPYEPLLACFGLCTWRVFHQREDRTTNAFGLSARAGANAFSRSRPRHQKKIRRRDLSVQRRLFGNGGHVTSPFQVVLVTIGGGLARLGFGLAAAGGETRAEGEGGGVQRGRGYGDQSVQAAHLPSRSVFERLAR